MKKEIFYTIALEKEDNCYIPIHRFPKIKNIDNITSCYTEEEFRKMLVKNYYVNPEYINYPLVILYNNDKIIDEGFLFNDISSSNMYDFVKKFMSLYRVNSIVISDLYQYVLLKEDFNEEDKLLFKRINNSINTSNYNFMLDNIYKLDYYVVRSIYLYIIKVLYKKINKDDNYKLVRRIEK